MDVIYNKYYEIYHTYSLVTRNVELYLSTYLYTSVKLVPLQSILFSLQWQLLGQYFCFPLH